MLYINGKSSFQSLLSFPHDDFDFLNFFISLLKKDNIYGTFVVCSPEFNS